MPNSLFSLPSSLLVLLSSAYLATAEPWPYNLPKHEKYWPEYEELAKRDAYIQERLVGQTPAAVQKMSGDPGEKFYLHYWQFEDASVKEKEDITDTFRGRAQAVDADRDERYSNSSVTESLLPPLLLHSESQDSSRSLLRFFARNLFEKRDFQCPTGTNSCANIDRPNSCCPADETCVIVEDTGLGDVGCCPAGSTCSGGVSNCNTDAGYTSCPESENGGCCIPGYTCQDVGCIVSNTVTMTTTLPPATSTISTRTTSTSSTNPTTSSEETTRTIAESSSSTTSESSTRTTVSSSTSQGTTTCSTGFRSCPASLGGGCCPTDRACGSAECPALSTASSTSSSATGALPPVRPTSDVDSVTQGPSSTRSINGCPTGFYACSAYYQGGCCRVGRDCQKTSCPAVSTTALVSNGVTIVAQTGASFASESGSCATGWYSCAASQGGRCCPSGYGCGSICTYTATGTASASAVAKIAPSAGADVEVWSWLLALVGLGSGVAMLAL